jgi:hypothetical protein
MGKAIGNPIDSSPFTIKPETVPNPRKTGDTSAMERGGRYEFAGGSGSGH